MALGGPDIRNLYKTKFDGTNITKLTDDNVERMNISGGYIYYTKIMGPPGGDLYKMRLDGTNKMSFNINFVIQVNLLAT